jgi:hypothetical protein
MFCRKCYYDLRGQVEPRCPECGTPYDSANRDTVLWERPNLALQSVKRIAIMTIVAIIIGFVILVHTMPHLFFNPGH